jgi:serine protease
MTGDDNRSWARRTFLKTTAAAGAAATVTTTVSADGVEKVRLNFGMANTATMSAAEAEVQSETPGNAEMHRRSNELGFLSMDVPKPAAENVKEAFEQKEEFRYVEYDVQMHAFETPNDSLYDQQYSPQQVRAPSAYDTTKGSSDVTIAIVDQGVDYEHPDLQGAFGSVKGKDFVDGDNDPAPESASQEYHGTHVAGSAAAVSDNGTGIAGISNSTLLSARALGTGGGGSLADIAEAVRWSADQGADIINMSLGGGGYTDTMKNAVSYAVSNGTLPICAAGNDGSSSVSYPAAFSECVAVSAVDSNEDLASFSQYGENCDVASPGVDVLSTWTEFKSQYGGDYNKISGTSMACPNASGVAALGLAAAGGSGALTPNELRARLKDTAVDIGLSDLEQGAGRVDALNIVEAGGGGGGGGNEGPSASFSVSSSSPTVGDSVTFDGSASSDPDGSISSYSWDFGDGASASGQSVTHTYGSSGDFTATLTVTDDSGATNTASEVVSVQSDGGGGGTEQPVARIDVSPSSPDVGESVTFDGSASSDPDGGSISSYAWESSTGGSASGSSVTGSWNEAQDVTVSLTVTDDEGETDTESVTVSIGGNTNQGPSASFDVSTTSPTVGDTVSVDASASSDPDGSIASYDWDFGDGSGASGQTASNAYADAGDYSISLTVTDGDGATDTATQSITVESDTGGGGSCGDTSASASANGSLMSYYDDTSFTYASSLGDPCQATFTLTGPSSADFDLYVTFDGRTPSTSDYDARSITYGSDEQIVVDDVASGQEFGILVDSYSGGGSFTIGVEELGK